MAPEWEELEFLVGSGASATVVGPYQIKTIAASDPDPSRFYKLADGSIIPHHGQNIFTAVTEHKTVSITTNVADVDMPLLSVAQIVYNGDTVHMSPDNCYVQYKGRRQGCA